MWTDEWIGLPYEELGRGPDAFDCLGLFVALQRARHDRLVFDPMCTMSMAARRKVAEVAKGHWMQVPWAEEGNALLFKVRGLELHVGYALDRNLMLHTSGETGESMIENYTTSRWGDKLEGVYAHARR